VLDLKIDREAVPPKDAATLVAVRDGAEGIESFCVERSKQSRFLGGAIVFPGGKVDAADLDARWLTSVSHISPRTASFAEDSDTARALAIAASREALEEAALLPISGGKISHEDLLALRKRAETEPSAILEMLEARGLVLDLAALEPLSRWLTPAAEARRYDTRFFLVRAPEDQPGAHDDHETMSSFWASPKKLLARFDAGEVQLAPPTHRTLEILARAATVDAAFEIARHASLEVICPELVKQTTQSGETMALVLPGDPEHSIQHSRIAGKTRFVLRDGRFVPEDAPPRT
jgi:8-oxo-dGTP pyrophosphatase MutT (NUDIX family)